MQIMFYTIFWLIVIGVLSYLTDSGYTFALLFLGALLLVVLFNYCMVLFKIKKHYVFPNPYELGEFDTAFFNNQKDFQKKHQSLIALGFVPKFTGVIDNPLEEQQLLVYMHIQQRMYCYFLYVNGQPIVMLFTEQENGNCDAIIMSPSALPFTSSRHINVYYVFEDKPINFAFNLLAKKTENDELKPLIEEKHPFKLRSQHYDAQQMREFQELGYVQAVNKNSSNPLTWKGVFHVFSRLVVPFNIRHILREQKHFDTFFGQ